MPSCSSLHFSAWTNSVLVIASLWAALVPVRAACQATNSPQPAASAEYRVTGTVVSKSDGHPLDHAGIALVDVKSRKNAHTMITSEDGKFVFDGLPAGKYALSGQRKGYINAGYDSHEQFSTAIVTGAELSTENLVLRLAPAGLIVGKVLDESGEPVRHAMVTVYFEDHSSGVGRVQQFRSAQTDDQGEYEATSLLPGAYFVSASATPWYAVHPGTPVQTPGLATISVDRSLDVTYPLTYYGDVTEADSASPIPIRGGEHMQADIQMSPVHALSMRFHVPEDGQNGFQVPQLLQIGFDGSANFVQGTGMTMVSPGIMEITGIPEGKYNVRLNGQGTAAQVSGLDLTKENQELDLSTAEALSNVKISVNIPGEIELPRGGVVALRSGRRVPIAVQQVNAKGKAQLEQVPPGVYDVMVWNFGKPYSVDHMEAEGARAQGRKVTIASGSSPSISLTLVSGDSQVHGVVQRAGKGIGGAMVVLAPKDPVLHRDLFRRDQSDLDGTFSLLGIVPGSYTIFAIENGWELNWSEPSAIAPYLKRGRSVQIAGHSGQPVDLGDPIEVQSIK